MADTSPYVVRPRDLEALRGAWEAAQAGTPTVARLVAPSLDGAAAALSDTFQRSLAGGSADVLRWRVPANDQDNGVNWLLRAYAALVAEAAGDVLLRGKVEMVLNSTLPTETKRVQDWFTGFVDTLKEAKPDRASGQVQLRIPQDNPLIALVEIARALSRKLPIVLDLPGAATVASVLPAQFVQALLAEVDSGHKLLVILHDEPEDEARKATATMAFLDLVEHVGPTAHTVVLEPWGEEEAAAHLASRGKTGDAAALARLSQGRPAVLSDLIDVLDARGQLDSIPADLSLADLAPITVDEDELDVPDEPAAEGTPAHATADNAGQVAFVAALLGHAFPSALVAEIGGFDRDSVDDLLDAMGDLVEEDRRDEQMGTWIYKFIHPSYRDSVLARFSSEADDGIARNVALFLERFLAPRGVGFVQRAARIFADHGAPGRAARMRALAMSMDNPDVWGLAYELMRYYDEVSWSDAMRRTVGTTLLDHLAQAGNPQVADRVHGELTEWAQETDATDLQAWLLLNGSKLDLRRQDLYRARDRARDALALFDKLDDKTRAAECHLQLASIALADGRDDDALEAANDALKTSAVQPEGADQPQVPPQIATQAMLVRGLVARRKNDLDAAVDAFEQANAVAGQTGQAANALDAGLNLGEALLAKGDTQRAREVLGRMFTAARQIGASAQERAAADLLARIEANNRNLDGALQLAQRALQISQQNNMQGAIPFDLHRVGSLLLAKDRAKEALPLLQQAAKFVEGRSEHPLAREVWYAGGIAAARAGDASTATTWLDKALPLLEKAGDARRYVASADQLAAVHQAAGKGTDAIALLEKAVDIAGKAGLKDERRALTKRLEQLRA